MKRRFGTFTKRKPIVQLDDAVKENYGLGFKKEIESEQNLKCDDDQVTNESINLQGPTDSANAIKFVKGGPGIKDMDSKLNDFLKEINDLVEEGPTQKVAKVTTGVEEITEPIPPTCSWQAVLDEGTQCCYYWNVHTNKSTWNEPPEYAQYLVAYKAFESEYTNYARTREEQKKIDDKKNDKIEKTKTSSPSLVPYDYEDDEHNKSTESAGGEQTTKVSEEEEEEGRISKKRSNDAKERETSSKRFKLALDRGEIKRQVELMDEANSLLENISKVLATCDRSTHIDGLSIESIETSLQTRMEDWMAGYLPTSYLVSKFQACLSMVLDELEQKMDVVDIISAQDEDTDGVAIGEEIPEVSAAHPPPPPDELFAPPPPPEPCQPPAPRSLIPMDYGEDTDDNEDEDGANSEMSTELNLSATSSPFPPLEEGEIPLTTSENSNNSDVKAPTIVKKPKVLTAASISVRKKKVSKLVEKWQKIQKELEH